jgi:hypothetical protein
MKIIIIFNIKNKSAPTHIVPYHNDSFHNISSSADLLKVSTLVINGVLKIDITNAMHKVPNNARIVSPNAPHEAPHNACYNAM